MPDNDEVVKTADVLARETAEKAKILAEEAAARATALAEALSGTLNQVSASLKDLQETKANKRTIVLLVISIILDITLSVVAIFLVIGQLNQANQVKQTNVSQCLENNTGRAQDLTLWNTLLYDLDPPGTKLSPKLAAELSVAIKTLHTLANAKDAPRDCVKIYAIGS